MSETRVKQATKTKHTPGPWKRKPLSVDVMSGQEFVPIFAKAGKNQTEQAVSDAYWLKGTRRAEFEANARLIAAAPELLEVAERVANHPCTSIDFQKKNGPDCYCANCRARVVVAKARGES